MKQVLLILTAVVMLVGCGQPAVTREEAEKEEAKMQAIIDSLEAEAKASTEVKAAEEEEKLITDPHLEKKVRREINKRTGELTKADLDKVTSLKLHYLGLVTKPGTLVEVMKGLEKLTQLEDLGLSGNQLTSVQGLEKLTQLKILMLGENKLTELPKGLENLTQLRQLELLDNRLTSVKGLEKLTKLEELSLHHNKLTDVKGLENLTQLEYLTLYKNQLTDVKGLEKLTQLEDLDLENNPDLTKAQIDELQKALPNCEIRSNPKK